MSESGTIDFVLKGELHGVVITPRTLGLSAFNEYNLQVERFIAGTERTNLQDAQVEIYEGSYALRVALTGVVLASVASDLQLLKREDSLGELDPKRAEIIQKWQSRAKSEPNLEFEVRPHGVELPKIHISRETDYRIGDVVPWVMVRKYLFGEVVDMGGTQKANIHLKLQGRSKAVIVTATQDYLRELHENRLYHKALLHVEAQQHSRTGELRNVRLISFADYEPKFSEEALDRFAAKGAEAWADVPDAAEWVRQVRGGY